MSDIRRHFHGDLQDLERRILGMGSIAKEAVLRSVTALVAEDLPLALEVVAEDQELDHQGLEFERLWLQTMALQTPVAVDLRLMSVLQQLNHSVLRVGDQAVNIAKVVRDTTGMKRSDAIVGQLREMGQLVDPMLRLAFEALERRELVAHQLDEMDDPVDALNRNMYKEVVACADDPDELAWATRMLVVSRALERVGDRAVFIAQQVEFLVRGSYDLWDERDTGSDA